MIQFTWDPKNKDEADLAEKIHRHAVTKEAKSGTHYHAKAFKVKRGGKQGDEMPTFDKQAGSMIMVFP